MKYIYEFDDIKRLIRADVTEKGWFDPDKHEGKGFFETLRDTSSGNVSPIFTVTIEPKAPEEKAYEPGDWKEDVANEENP